MTKPPVLDPASVTPRTSSGYPAQFRPPDGLRLKRALGEALGLTRLGVNLTTLQPGGASALRHWHRRQDEFVYIVSGEAVLITDAGETVLGPGMAAGFAAGLADGHHLVNRSDRPVTYLEISDRTPSDEGVYPDDDLLYIDGRFTDRKGKPY